MAKDGKNRFFVGICYLENMVDDWEVKIGDIIELPYAYCIHNLDVDSKSEHRKDHVHIIIRFANTTTHKHALEVFDSLSAPGRKCCPCCEGVFSIRKAYDYLIHDTETCKKVGKHLYKIENRITGNGFDIGSYEQLGTEEKHSMARELEKAIIEEELTNYFEFYKFVISNFDERYIDIIRSYSGHYERLLKGVFHMKKLNCYKDK